MKKKKILVVDDEKDLRDLLKWFLKSKDYEVLEASDGKSSLDIVKKEKPDLVLLDIMMPDLDGWEVSKKIKEDRSFKSTPISMLSVLSTAEAVDKSLKYAHADVHLFKPIDFYLLTNTVKSLLDRYEKGPNPPRRPEQLKGDVPSEVFKPLDSNNN
jgi:DNA-binding response OmpR family regulator